MQVYLIRHTEPDIAQGICYGQFDVPLKINKFKKNVHQIRKIIPANIQAYYSSPLKRCRTLAEQFGKNIYYDNRLMELNFGAWENKQWNEINKKDLDIWMTDYINSAPPNGETYLQLKTRAESFIEDLLYLNYEQAVLITHAGFIRSFISLILNLPLQNSFRIEIGYGSVVSITLQPNPSLNKLNLIYNY